MPPLGAGQIVDEDDITTLENASTAKPIGRLVASGTQALNDDVTTVIAFSTEEIDTHSFHSTSVNNSRVTPTVPGYYRFFGTAFIATLATPVQVDSHLRKNGTAVAPGPISPGRTSPEAQFTTALVECNGSTDYVELAVRQNSAANDTTNQSSQFSSVLEWEFVRGL
jgi:hypothetical protein